ncbi:MAG TPA: type IV toxin-antitoxin system AbiEi family antitoxin domain-containing protein [Solirubrobacterales bacterium]|nr:type IV toxin-antitoxin system AbiEi family antitoxin domain-containing protein [Solirubrobacterales bacterium]
MAERATVQGGVISLDQLRGVGVSPRAASGRAEEGSLHRIHRGVYVPGHRALARTALLRAAVLACGDGAVVSHGTAAALWGLSDRWPVLIDVTVPVETGRKLDGIRCRRCRYPNPTEICEHQGVICTTPARTLVDQAGKVGVKALREQVEQAAVLKLLDLDELDLAMARAKGRRGLKWLRAIADGWRSEDGSVPDVRSVFEARALPRLVALGLPRPLCNEPIQVDGETLIVDFFWPEQRFVVETDGRETHETPVAFQRDRRRDQLLLAAGYRPSRVTWIQMRDEFDAVVARTANSLTLPHRVVPY